MQINTASRCYQTFGPSISGARATAPAITCAKRGCCGNLDCTRGVLCTRTSLQRIPSAQQYLMRSSPPYLRVMGERAMSLPSWHSPTQAPAREGSAQLHCACSILPYLARSVRDLALHIRARLHHTSPRRASILSPATTV